MVFKNLKIASMLVSPSAFWCWKGGWRRFVRWYIWHSGVCDVRLSVVGYVGGKLVVLHGWRGNNGWDVCGRF
jgi:hypothetical protein